MSEEAAVCRAAQGTATGAFVLCMIGTPRGNHGSTAEPCMISTPQWRALQQQAALAKFQN